MNCAGIAPAAKIVGRQGPAAMDDLRKVVDPNPVCSFNLLRPAAAQMRLPGSLHDGARGRVSAATIGGMKTVRDLLKPPHVVGRVEALVVRSHPRLPASSVPATQAVAGVGLADDRLGQRGQAELSTRQVTLIQHEHLPVIAALAGVPAVDVLALRRNVVVSGINLVALKNARVRVGAALLEVVGPCQPCSRMEEAVGPGGYAAMRGHGGMTARVIEGGPIAVGDAVRAEPDR